MEVQILQTAFFDWFEVFKTLLNSLKVYNIAKHLVGQNQMC
jgi:hypothetical protein